MTRLIAMLAILMPGWALGQTQGPQSAFRFRIPADPRTLDWTLAQSPSEVAVAIQHMEGMAEIGPDLSPRPRLAERWEVSEDQKTYTFFLRKGVRWTDGMELVAEHFKASWEQKSAQEAHIGKDEILSVRATGPMTLVATLRRPLPYFLHTLTLPQSFPVRPDLIKKWGKSWPDSQHLVTLGPYKLDRWVPLRFLRFLRNPTFFSESAKGPDLVEILVEPDEKRHRSLFAVGSIDALCPASQADLEKARHSDLEVRSDPGLSVLSLGFNVLRPWVSDLRVRKALILALDPKKLATGFLPPALKKYTDDKNTHSVQLQDAKSMLAKLSKPPKTLKLLVERGGGREEWAWELARTWHDTLSLDVKTVDQSPADFKLGRGHTNYDFVLFQASSDIADPAPLFDQIADFTHWHHGGFNKSIEEGRFAKTPGERAKHYAQAEAIMTQIELAAAPLEHSKKSCVLGRSVKATELAIGGWPIARLALVK